MRLLFIFSFLWINFQLFAQSLNDYQRAAEEAFAKKDYFNAAYYYDIVLQSRKKTAIYYQSAEANRLSYAYQKAAKAYEMVRNSEDKSKYPLLEFHYGSVLKHLARYEDAAAAFSRFEKSYTTADYYQQKARQEFLSCNYANTIKDKPNDSIIIVRLGDNINSEYSDFSASEQDSFIYFSSLKYKRERAEDEKKEKGNPKRLIAKLLRIPNPYYINPASPSSVPSDAEATFLAELNTESDHNANLSWAADNKTVFFTRCEGKDNEIRCDIYTAEWDFSLNKFVNIIKLDNSINAVGKNSTHPQLVYQKELKKYLLYYATDRAEGLGKMDIWAAEWQGGYKFAPAFNLGATINTIDDEVCPFYNLKTDELYFSSNWHLGLGGFDVFKSKRLGNTLWQNPTNLGLPYNSAANDLYFIINDNDTSGYLASNRVGSMTLAGESCCNDIYRYGYKSDKKPPLDTPKVDTPLLVVNIPNKDPKNPATPNTRPDIPNTKIDTPTFDLTDLNKMLPLRLYFHNDEPDSNSTAATTDKPYEYPYQDYMDMKKLYQDNHATQFAPETQPMVMQQISNFFEDEVKGEYNRMNYFFDEILKLLDKGARLEIVIQGYTSPRTTEQYNKNLSMRRIASVKKQLFIYKNGIFLKHFQQGHFSVKEQPNGETLAPKGIADAIDDPRNSIFSVEASRERRAEIVVLQKK